MDLIADQQGRCEEIKASLVEEGLFAGTDDAPGEVWRISPEAFSLSKEDVLFFEQLGNHLLSFYSALNRLYRDSHKGNAPSWVARYLDQGKPGDLVDLSRMNRFKGHLPGIIRPDVMVTERGFKVTELDSVPGGFGRTAGLMEFYREADQTLVGEKDGGIPDLFYRMLEEACKKPGCKIALVVSDEAEDYRSEMQYLAGRLQGAGKTVVVCHPRDLIFREEGLYLEIQGRESALDGVYRFFELFDLKNIPKSELIAYAMKKGNVSVTPPYKPYLEEKLSFALFHHPALSAFWEKALGNETFDLLTHLIPRTWILDPRPLPPQAVIPGLKVNGRVVQGWDALMDLTQKERELVIKTSGFSPTAWGSRGVLVGHDVPAEEWQATLTERLRRFEEEPAILQEFHKGRRFKTRYYDGTAGSIREMQSRVRLTPYYFVVSGKACLGGMLATLVPEDKKKIHGMVDAVMVPCSIATDSKKKSG